MSVEPGRQLVIDDIASVATTIVAGAAGWVDVDLSASLLGFSGALFQMEHGNAVQIVIGTRKPGSAGDGLWVWPNQRIARVCGVGQNGHVEMIRIPLADVVYTLMARLR